MKSLENEQLDQIVNCMQKKTYDPKTDIIVEGSVGERLYVLAAGKVQAWLCHIIDYIIYSQIFDVKFIAIFFPP